MCRRYRWYMPTSCLWSPFFCVLFLFLCHLPSPSASSASFSSFLLFHVSSLSFHVNSYISFLQGVETTMMLNPLIGSKEITDLRIYISGNRIPS